MRKRLLVVPLVALMLGGCVGDENPNNPVRGIAASLLVGQTFDKAQSALLREDWVGFEKACQDFSIVSAGNDEMKSAFAIPIIQQAGDTFAAAQQAEGSDQTELLLSAERQYRAALDFVPRKNPEKWLDPFTLNSVGYYLADHGQSHADFEQAAQLALASYQKWPMQRTIRRLNPELERAIVPQDSYAWALFKLGKYNEARQQEEEVVKIMRANNVSGSAISELFFHMAEIYNALGNLDAARQEYEEALKMGADGDIKEKIEMGLKALDFKRV